MSDFTFLNRDGDFVLQHAQRYPHVYFPLANDGHMISSVTPCLTGDCKTGQNTFLLAPAGEVTLTDRSSSRNFWVQTANESPWSVTGCSARQLAGLYTPSEEECTLTGGLLWQQTQRTQAGSGLQAQVLSFVPAGTDTLEIMQVTLTNKADHAMSIRCITAIPLYCRSADNIRDHRHVTSLLHRAKMVDYGMELLPTLTFDERGHKPGRTIYRVWAAGDGNVKPEFMVPLTADFEGHSGGIWPRGVLIEPEESARCHAGDLAQGGEMTAALYFPPRQLAAGETVSYRIVMSIDCDPAPYLRAEKVKEALEETRKYWLRQSALTVGEDRGFAAWMRWVAIQPVLRRICGCSFLPHHDYGRGGRGWRDLWQDSLALLLADPASVRQDLTEYFAGVRPDGTNATIIGDRPGEFKADRNGIPRVWMDHGFWPFVTCRLYLDQTGDTSLLFQEKPYFDDGFAFRGEGERREVSPLRTGSVLEHILVEHVTAFFDTGENGNIRLRGADWNDGLDMAARRGESVAFTAAYGGSLLQLAELLRRLAPVHPTLELHPSLRQLMEADFSDRRETLLAYCAAAYESREAVPVDTLSAARRLEAMGQDIFRHIRSYEMAEDGEGHRWMNSYYDDHGRQVEGSHENGVRMMLTGQVFGLMSGAIPQDRVDDVICAVDRYLFHPERGGYCLNTDFHEVKDDMGRMFGFAYGTKENGAVFSHMAVMYAYALYARGRREAGWKVLQCLYRQSSTFEASSILPGIPEYFDLAGRGMYPYLTGAASWFLLTMQTMVFGVKGEQGDLVLQPQLCEDQFNENGRASISLRFGGKPLTITYVRGNATAGEGNKAEGRGMQDTCGGQPGDRESGIISRERVRSITREGRVWTDRIPREEMMQLPDGAELTAVLA